MKCVTCHYNKTINNNGKRTRVCLLNTYLTYRVLDMSTN